MLLRKCPDNILLYVTTNSSLNDSSRKILDELLTIKEFQESSFPSSLNGRNDDGKASLSVSRFNYILASLESKIKDNGNICSVGLLSITKYSEQNREIQ